MNNQEYVISVPCDLWTSIACRCETIEDVRKLMAKVEECHGILSYRSNTRFDKIIFESEQDFMWFLLSV